MTLYRQSSCNFTIMRKLLVFIILFGFSSPSFASHIVGGDLTYICLPGNQYRFTLSIYRDCRPPNLGGGNPQALLSDNPAFISIFEGNNNFFSFDSVLATVANGTLVPLEFNNNCVKDVPPKCLNKIEFVFTRTLPPNSSGYDIVFQRCCRNEATLNIRNGGATGASIYCTVPPSTVNCNNSAVFKNAPPQIVCINNPFVFDNSATDIDGDSLSYEFCAAVRGANQNNPKPINTTSPPPYASVTYQSPYSPTNPIAANPTLSINPTTGVITGTPRLQGIFAITVCCKEWRNGVVINTIRRDFQIDVTNCSKAVIANIPVLSQEPNTYVINCKDSAVTFQNNSSGGFSYLWDFGVPGITTDVSTAQTPTYVYPDTGTYIVKLVVNPGTTCPDSIERIVKIYPRFNADYSFAGLFCPDLPINFTDLSSSTNYPVNYWQWNFDDGTNSSLQNVAHTFPNVGKGFNVQLVSGNAIGCRDTISKIINIPEVILDAGNDTTILKNEFIQYFATGAQTYNWSPPDFLDNPNIANPRGFYTNTGVYQYIITGTTFDGCPASDTLNVTVSDKPYIIVPNAFSPNGDGNNDLLRLLSSGFKRINFYRIYNRWGQKVFETNDYYIGWDGTLNGVAQPISTFFWVVSATDLNDNEQVFRGDVTLIR